MSQAALIVLIHGALMDRRSMLALTPMLPNHHAVLCPDLAGHGQRRNEHEHLAELNPRELAVDLLRQLPIQSLTFPAEMRRHTGIEPGGPSYVNCSCRSCFRISTIPLKAAPKSRARPR